MVKISPSILSADFSNLEREIKAIDNAGADYIHIDVMDGAFVPNITIGPAVIQSIRKHSNLPFDVHLMIENPEFFIEDFAEAGSNIITIHPEATKHLDRTLTKIRNLGCKSGISLLPSTNIDTLQFVLDKIDLVLVMSVNPGFGGQKFITSQLQKIEKLSALIKNSGYNIEISVDGGINEQTSRQCIDKGANVLVAGNYIFSGEYSERIRNLKTFL